jgi:hypothetical protein
VLNFHEGQTNKGKIGDRVRAPSNLICIKLMIRLSGLSSRRLEITLKQGSGENWVNFIMQCVFIVVKFNAEENESFKPTRGLRLSPSISLYFSFMYEGLS